MGEFLPVWVGFGAIYSKDDIINEELKKKGLEPIPYEVRTTNNWKHELKRRFSGDIGKLKAYECVYDETVHAPDFYERIPLRAGARDALEDMLMSSFEIRIVTSYSGTHKSDMVRKLERVESDFPDIPAFFIPDKVHTGRGKSVGMHDRRILESGFFITSDMSAAQGMPKGCTYLMLEEALHGKTDLPLVSFNEKSQHYWGKVLTPKVTTKITPPEYSGDTSTIIKNSSVEG